MATTLFAWLFFYSAGALLLRLLGVRAQRRYFHELDLRSDTGLSFDTELEAARKSPLSTLSATPRRNVQRIRAIAESQQDPYLERLRQECVRWRLVSWVFTFVCAVLVIVTVVVSR